MSKKNFWVGLLTGVMISAFIGCGIICINIFTLRSGAPLTIASQAGQTASDNGIDSVLEDPNVAAKIGVLEGMIDLYYIDSVSKNDIENGIYSGIMDSLNDPYACYYTPGEWIAMQNSTQGIYYGIGAYLMKSETLLYPQVTGIIRDTPAEESDLMVDDYIYMVDGVDVYDMDLSAVVAMIKGEQGTTVHLTIVRQSTGEQLEMDIERRKVETPTVELKMMENNIAYISISEFDGVTVDQFADALATAKGSGMEGLILDLRGNPGGSLTAVVDIARMILPEGRIVYTEDKYGQQEEYSCDGTKCLDVPMVVLVNGGSASASEILAGAIKDYGIGTLLGTTTYGKGIVQRIITLQDGSAVKLTVSHYYTPLGNDIHKVGIIPDIEVEFDAEAYQLDQTDNQLDEAVNVITEMMQ
ncbi:MAG TPA: S41 family peptidase [Lachnospiraceae bacterium]|nr:S41 family peptidase [Lachnospiraceae bacterium]